MFVGFKHPLAGFVEPQLTNLVHKIIAALRGGQYVDDQKSLGGTATGRFQ